MYQIFFPARTLQPYIQVYWMVHSAQGQSESIRENIFVDGRADIVFNFGCAYGRRYLTEAGREESLAQSNLDGQREYPVSIVQDGVIDLVGVRFKPGGLAAFLSLPCYEVSNQTVELNSVFGVGAIELENRLFDSVDTAQRVALLDNFFLQRLSLPTPYEFARQVAESIEAASGIVSMKTLSSQVGYSIRTVDRLFRQCFGLSPKFYARVMRFQRALTLLSSDPQIDLTQITFECGYYDPSHLTREFTDFTGQAPSLYRTHLLEKSAAPPPNLVQFLQAP